MPDTEHLVSWECYEAWSPLDMGPGKLADPTFGAWSAHVTRAMNDIDLRVDIAEEIVAGVPADIVVDAYTRALKARFADIHDGLGRPSIDPIDMKVQRLYTPALHKHAMRLVWRAESVRAVVGEGPHRGMKLNLTSPAAATLIDHEMYYSTRWQGEMRYWVLERRLELPDSPTRGQSATSCDMAHPRLC